MIRVTGVGRRMLLVAVGLSAVALGWVLLFEVTSPGVAAKLPTGPLAAVIALQVLPLLAWLAWRADRALHAEIAEGVGAESEEAKCLGAEGDEAVVMHAPEPASAAQAAPDRIRPRSEQVMPVHRVTHMPRSRGRVSRAPGAVG